MNRPAAILVRARRRLHRQCSRRRVGCLRRRRTAMARGPENPFVSHAFLDALEQSGSVGRKTGWLPQHLVIEDAPARCSPPRRSTSNPTARANTCSTTAGPRPTSAPAAAIIRSSRSPRPSRRCRGRACWCAPAACDREARAALISALISAVENSGVSSLHVTFAPRAESDAAGAGRVPDPRSACSITGPTTATATFDDFLAALNSRKRKAIRKERAAVAEYGLDIRACEGAELTAAALGRLLRLLHGYRQPQMGPALSQPRFLRPHRGRHCATASC